MEKNDFIAKLYTAGLDAYAKAGVHDEAGHNMICLMTEKVVGDTFAGGGKTGSGGKTAVKVLSCLLIVFVIPVFIIMGTVVFRHADHTAKEGFLRTLFSGRIYYMVSVLMVFVLQILFFAMYEKDGRKRMPGIIASMVAINVVGRAAFFMFSDFKPVFAITIISGIALGSIPGFMVGAFTMLVSNFLFGQGPWTPWQMLALGMMGFLSGALSEAGVIPRRRLTLSLYGFAVTVAVYGGIMNPAAMMLSVAEPDIKLLAAYYLSGLPVDIVKGVAAFIFLWLTAGPFLKKFERLGKR